MKDSYKSLKGQAGIYKISIGPHIYVGQSINLHSRLKTHKSQLKSGNHPNYRVQESYNHYGKFALVIEVLLIINNNDTTTQDINNKLNLMESNYIKELHADLNIQQVNPKRSTRFYRPQKVDTRNIITSTVLPTKLLKSFKSNWLYINPTERIVKTIGQDLFKLLQEAVPNVLANPKLRNLFLAILTKASTDGYVVTSEEWIAYYVDEYAAYHSNNHHRFTAIKFLQALKDVLPTGWEMHWTDFDYKENKARTTKIIVPPHIIEAMYLDVRDRPTPRYYLYKWVTKATRYSNILTNEELKVIEQLNNQQAKCLLQEDILKYTSSKDLREYNYPNKEGAFSLIDTYPHGKRECYLATLNNVLDYPKPIYYPVDGCYRLYASGLQFLKSDIRHVLYPKLIELDLKSCHLAILAMLLDLKHTKQVLKETSIWAHLLTYTARFIAPFFYPILKKTIKTTIYALCFGASPSASKKIFKERLIGEGFTLVDIKPLWNAFSQIEVIQELMQSTQLWRTQLLQAGQCIDPFGNTHILTTKEDVKTACFNICSAYELMLIHPIYQEAIEETKKNKPLFRVLLHSHDGVSISLAKPHLLKPVVKRLTQAVQEKADELNIYTTLEHKF